MFDFVGVKALAPGGAGSRQMGELHDVAMDAAAENGFDRIARIYTWNDSVLLLAYVSKRQQDYECALRDVYTFKGRIDQVQESYGAVVKGQSFPYPQGQSTSQNDRFVFIEASSYAMANCMDIPRHFKKKKDLHRWYLDERVSCELCGLLAQPASQLKIPLLPTNEGRYVYAYDELWRDDKDGPSQSAALVTG